MKTITILAIILYVIMIFFAGILLSAIFKASGDEDDEDYDIVLFWGAILWPIAFIILCIFGLLHIGSKMSDKMAIWICRHITKNAKRENQLIHDK